MADQAHEGLLSPFLRTQRINAAKRFLKGKVLDYGCGSGALCEFVSPENYLGIDTDPVSIERARELYPNHRFETGSEPSERGFDTVVSLAVIEHVPNPASFLKMLRDFGEGSENTIVVCSTPNPIFEPLYDLGAHIGLFSHSAAEEHESLLDKRGLERTATEAGLDLLHYNRFLLGANQIAAFGQR